MSETQRHPRAYTNTLSAAVERMHQRRSEMLQSKIMNGSPTRDTHVRFEEAVLTLYYELRFYAIDERKTRELWEKNNLDALPRICGKVVKAKKSKQSGGMAWSEEGSEVDHADPEELLEASRAMDEIAHELDFTVKDDNSLPSFGFKEVDDSE